MKQTHLRPSGEEDEEAEELRRRARRAAELAQLGAEWELIEEEEEKE